MTFPCHSIQDFLEYYPSCPRCDSVLELELCPTRFITGKQYMSTSLKNTFEDKYLFTDFTNKNFNILIDINNNKFISDIFNSVFLRKKCPNQCFSYESLTVKTNEQFQFDNFLFIEDLVIPSLEIRKVYHQDNSNIFVNGTLIDFELDSKWWYLSTEQLKTKIDNLLLLK